MPGVDGGFGAGEGIRLIQGKFCAKYLGCAIQNLEEGKRSFGDVVALGEFTYLHFNEGAKCDLEAPL